MLHRMKGFLKSGHLLLASHDFQHIVAPDDTQLGTQRAQQAQIGIVHTKEDHRIRLFQNKMLFYHLMG